MEQFPLVLSSFAFDESNLKNIHNAIFALVKQGFSYSDAINMPLDQFYSFLEIASKNPEVPNNYPEQNTQRPIGEVVPNIRP